MGYSPNIPQPGDDPKESQALLLNNFTLLNNRWSVNHVALTSSSNVGYHTKIFFAAPITAPGLDAPLASLYTKTINGASELFYQNGAAAGDEVQLTNITPVTVGTQHFLVTPWNMEIQMGSGQGTNAHPRVLTFSTPFSNAAPTIYTAQITGIDCLDVKVLSVSKTALTYESSGSLRNIQYFIKASK